MNIAKEYDRIITKIDFNTDERLEWIFMIGRYLQAWEPIKQDFSHLGFSEHENDMIKQYITKHNAYCHKVMDRIEALREICVK